MKTRRGVGLPKGKWGPKGGGGRGAAQGNPYLPTPLVITTVSLTDREILNFWV